jgi:hypothetical protein
MEISIIYVSMRLLQNFSLAGARYEIIGTDCKTFWFDQLAQSAQFSFINILQLSFRKIIYNLTGG